jgi:hypothetical protein
MLAHGCNVRPKGGFAVAHAVLVNPANLFRHNFCIAQRERGLKDVDRLDEKGQQRLGVSSNLQLLSIRQ